MRCSPPVRISRSGSGRSGERQVLAERASSMSSASHLARDAAPRQLPRGASDVPAPAVRDGDDQRHARDCRRCSVSGCLHALAQRRRQLLQVADEAQADAVLVQLVDFVVERLEEAAHQHRDLFLRPLPVLAREREQRQHLDAAARAVLDDLLDGAHAHAMTGRTRQRARSGPAAVAVHDDRDVARNRLPCSSFFTIRYPTSAASRPASALFLFRRAPGRSRRRACRSASALPPARAGRRPARPASLSASPSARS